jgi:ABC-type branched-subunit amino acid transport system ATPase component
VAELTRTGLTVLLVEQQPEHARAVTDRLVFLSNGAVTDRAETSTDGAAGISMFR